MNQVARNQELLDTARDYFLFTTKFFELINLSAIHIYHSALELSPCTSIVQRLYYHQQPVTSPRVIFGTPDLWDGNVNISNIPEYRSSVWSPCSRFVTTLTGKNAEIRDVLSSELVATLTGLNPHPDCGLAYSPDGCYLACLSDTLTIWDIQTGGMAKETQYNKLHKCSKTIVWSLDGKTIGIIDGSAVYVYNIALGTTLFPGTLQSIEKPHLWAYDKSFRIMTVGLDDQVLTVEIFEVGSNLSKIKSFHIKSWKEYSKIGSFSPTTYRISIFTYHKLCILDIQNSEYLLEERGNLHSHCFSSDGSLFAASSVLAVLHIHIWKYTSGHYTIWRKFLTQEFLPKEFPHQFSPTSSLVLCHFRDFLRVIRLDGPPIATDLNDCVPLAVLSPCGTYVASTHGPRRTVMTITNLSVQTTSQPINTDMELELLAITGNVLLAIGYDAIAAWQLTDEGLVDGVFGNRVAGRGDSIWVVSVHFPEFKVEGQTVIIREGEQVVHVYHTGTGEVLKPAEAYLFTHTLWYTRWDMYACRHYPHCHRIKTYGIPPKGAWPISAATLLEGWVKDPKGKNRLWMPIEWRTPFDPVGLTNITTLRLDPPHATVIIRFQ